MIHRNATVNAAKMISRHQPRIPCLLRRQNSSMLTKVGAERHPSTVPMMQTAGYIIRQAESAPTVPCPCGQSTRIVTAADGVGCSFHITEICDSVRHYHRKTAEVYYILEGSGQM